ERGRPAVASRQPAIGREDRFPEAPRADRSPRRFDPPSDSGGGTDGGQFFQRARDSANGKPPGARSALTMNTTKIREIITDHFRKTLKTLYRDGFVVGLSGGIDSTLTAHLAVEAMGPARVLGVIMPERESSPESKELGIAVAQKLGIDYEEVDLTKH